ncbi:MAG: ycgE 1 [Acidimicrobiales bacterium]|nr:ycgE 1 [Acidimicrobiales bacterium]
MRIGELSHRTGVSVATLRAWERRYRLLLPSRTAGGQRLYSADDEARVREVQQLIAGGYAVGAAAQWVAAGGSPGPGSGSIAGGPRSVGAPSPWGADLNAAARVQARGTTAVATAVERRAERPRPVDEDAHVDLERVHAATRAMVHAATPADVVAALAAYVREVGGSLVDAQIDEAVLPVDLSFGVGEPLLPRAEPLSVARLQLERSLPALVEDGRRLVALLRRAADGT